MFRTRFVFGFSVLFLAAGIVVVTAQGNANGPKSTHTTTTPKAPAPAPHTATKPASVKPAKPTTPTTTKNASATSPKTSPAKPQATAKTDKPAKATKSATASTKPTKKTTSTPIAAELTPVQQKLKQNTDLAAKVASRLPSGTDLMAASAGFKNLGQFVAAANVSNNLQISFTELKAKLMTGMSLGQAIQAVRPLTASPTVEAQRAEYDARGIIAESAQTTTASSSTVPTATPMSTTAKPKVKTKNSAQ